MGWVGRQAGSSLVRPSLASPGVWHPPPAGGRPARWHTCPTASAQCCGCCRRGSSATASAGGEGRRRRAAAHPGGASSGGQCVQRGMHTAGRAGAGASGCGGACLRVSAIALRDGHPIHYILHHACKVGGREPALESAATGAGRLWAAWAQHSKQGGHKAGRTAVQRAQHEATHR